MSLATVLADHCYHKKPPYKCKDQFYLGNTKRQSSGRLHSRMTTDGHLLTVLNKKRKYTKRNTSSQEKVREKEEKEHEKEREKKQNPLENIDEIKPEITEIIVPQGETLVGQMEKQARQHTHIDRWEIYEQVAAVVATADQYSNVLDGSSKTTTNEQTQGADGSRKSNASTNSASTNSSSVTSLETRFVDMSGINEQFNRPDDTAIYTIAVPEW